MKISKALVLAGTAICTVGMAAPAAAGPTITGWVSSSGYQGNNGLIVNSTSLYNSSSPFSFELNNTAQFGVLTLSTTEGSVNVIEDMIPRLITAAFTFTNPLNGGGNIYGASTGYYTPSLFGQCGVFAGGCGAVAWGAPQVFNFGNGGAFSVALSNVNFTTPGSATVNATFTLISDSLPAVPEPATWALMILGFGAIGAAMRAPRRQTTARIRFA